MKQGPCFLGVTFCGEDFLFSKFQKSLSLFLHRVLSLSHLGHRLSPFFYFVFVRWLQTLLFLTLVHTEPTGSVVTWSERDTHSCTARAIDSAVEPVSLTLSKVTFGRSSSSLSLLICLGDRPLWSACAART